MRTLIILGIIFFFGTTEIAAQSDFRDGYLINNQNDTIYGLIDYKGNKASSQKCIYRQEINSQNQVFTPEDIKAYRFTNGKLYVSKSINAENETEQLFLEYLINGIVDMYYYRNSKGEHYLLDDGSGNLAELKDEEKEIVINNTSYIRESKEYIGLLKYTFKDSPSISKRIDNVSLNHKSLIKLIRDYHNEVCEDEVCIIYEKKLPTKKKPSDSSLD